MRGEEHKEQVEFFQWLRHLYDEEPLVKHLVFAVPNGGLRGKREAMRMRAEGVRRGIPDIACMIPVGQYHGAFFEFKTRNGRVSPEQKVVAELLRQQGYHVEVAWGLEDLKKKFLAYLGIVEQ